MNLENCELEAQAAAAARSGEWSAELRAHVAGCETCAEAALVGEFLQAEPQSGHLPALPSAGQVWWKAQIRARRMDAQRALEPVRLVQRIAAACALAALFVLTLHYAPQLQTWASHISGAAVLDTEERLGGAFLFSAAGFLAAVSAGVSFMLRS